MVPRDMDWRILQRSAKELIRHLSFKVHAHGFIDLFRSRSAVRGTVLSAPTRGQRFSKIYDNGLWKHASRFVPESGEGSSLTATERLRSELPKMLDSLNIESVIDLGCGDFTWMRSIKLSQSYIGIDVVPALIEYNQRVYSGDGRVFLCLDAVEDKLPSGDAIFCREVLFHLSFSDIFSVLRNCDSERRRYLLATTDRTTLFNSDIRSGDFRRLNLQRPPFSFPVPDYAIDDDAIEPGRKIGIWIWDRLPKY